MTEIPIAHDALAIVAPDSRQSRLWWLPVLFAFAISPVNILLEAGYGIHVLPERWIYPLVKPLGALGISDGYDGLFASGLLFLTYGVILAIASLNHRTRRGILFVIGVHVLCCLLADPLHDVIDWIKWSGWL